MATESAIAETGTYLAAVCALNTFRLVIFARTIGWEAPPWAEMDRPYVASVVRYRMMVWGWSLERVLLTPRHFSVRPLLNKDPPEMGKLLPLAVKAMRWRMEDLPVKADHFYSPKWVKRPYWADPRYEVEVKEDVVHRFYRLR